MASVIKTELIEIMKIWNKNVWWLRYYYGCEHISGKAEGFSVTDVKDI